MKEMIQASINNSPMNDIAHSIVAHQIVDVFDASIHPMLNAPENNCDVFANVAPTGVATYLTGDRHRAMKKHRRSEGLVLQSVDTTFDVEEGFLQFDFHYGKTNKKEKRDRWGRRPAKK